MRRTVGLVVSAVEALHEPSESLAARACAVAGTGYWLQVDVDVLDPSLMPAVDSPDPGGFGLDELIDLLDRLAPSAVGASVTVFDPDLDPDGRSARVVTHLIVAGLSRLGADA